MWLQLSSRSDSRISRRDCFLNHRYNRINRRDRRISRIYSRLSHHNSRGNEIRVQESRVRRPAVATLRDKVIYFSPQVNLWGDTRLPCNDKCTGREGRLSSLDTANEGSFLNYDSECRGRSISTVCQPS